MTRNSKFIHILLLQILFLWLPVHSNDKTFVLAGYLPEYRSYINVNETSIHLTDLMLFSVTPEAVMSSDGCCLSSDHYDLIRKARSYKMEENNEVLRLLVTIGGAGRSNGFANIVGGNVQLQGKFVNELIKLCPSRDICVVEEEPLSQDSIPFYYTVHKDTESIGSPQKISEHERLDGIDLDFEGIQSIDEWKTYLELIIFVASRLNRHGLMVTVALHPGQFLPPKVCDVVDRVHVMTYDMIDGSKGRQGHHAELPAVQGALKSFIDRGCPSSKLVLGIPAYARNGQNPGLVKTYSEIIDDYFKDGHTMTNEFRKIGFVNGYYFDSPAMVASKVKYAKSIGLGGVFMWEVGQDKSSPDYSGGILLQAAANSILNTDSISGEL
ncbi:hypothetical protein HJC23_007743 [Cyclotella cryptica]|uniref:GH18 domain-containing protein n=1 Tax=Cyclotella cryptica TaxID=29204 RepID=A0ABD3QZJ9_9STRA|eukprot:CCRYP_000002-RA/>CCRYP_000002-RA protein AED:0.15 eAED:0.16 QI:1911/0/0.5/1/0/0/2/0/381